MNTLHAQSFLTETHLGSISTTTPARRMYLVALYLWPARIRLEPNGMHNRQGHPVLTLLRLHTYTKQPSSDE